ncbi:cobalamin-binding protein [Chamaesiphon minutus]|uniref:ABC-type Fe3+-hydroxamate transport system, periplasmic component n=1 Tax=Chamaesiphon minutus (strain ATCC 27169 / PCC 6605) TaxID=1173020 RepID=K9ULF6_CHAP6|nr:cobalamin-binding protein [Chamaesiphon minutus]AFY95034.1 ABC-type Fe3+-hydroxamate transport system, periplasmic component [Chamaesiphon minutus PCC 6605]
MTPLAPLRLISLLPSATEIIACLGLTDRLVGISHECDYPPEIKDRAVCTSARLSIHQPSGEIHQEVDKLLAAAMSIYEINLDVLTQLQPTHIITQDQCDVCAVSFPEVEKAVAKLTNSHPQIISLQPDTIADVWADIQRVGETLNVDWQPIVATLQKRVKICQTQCQNLQSPLPKVACIEWTDPLMLAGNWIPELVEMAGGKPIGGVTGQHSPRISWDELVAADPDTIIFMPCGFDLDRTRIEAQPLTKHPQWQQLAAVKQDRVYITDGNAYFNRPGPRLVESLEILTEILNPQVCNYGHYRTGWSEFS